MEILFSKIISTILFTFLPRLLLMVIIVAGAIFIVNLKPKNKKSKNSEKRKR